MFWLVFYLFLPKFADVSDQGLDLVSRETLTVCWHLVLTSRDDRRQIGIALFLHVGGCQIAQLVYSSHRCLALAIGTVTSRALGFIQRRCCIIRARNSWEHDNSGYQCHRRDLRDVS